MTVLLRKYGLTAGLITVPFLLLLVYHLSTSADLHSEVKKLEEKNTTLNTRLEALKEDVGRLQSSADQCTTAMKEQADQRVERTTTMTTVTHGAQRKAAAISQRRLPQPHQSTTGCSDTTALTTRALENAAIAAKIWEAP